MQMCKGIGSKQTKRILKGRNKKNLRQAQRNRTWPELTHWLMVPEGLLENLGNTSVLLILPMVTPLRVYVSVM